MFLAGYCLTTTIRCEDANANITVYADGVEVKTTGSELIGGTLPDDTSLVAISCAGASSSGIRGFFSNGYMTDSSWRCNSGNEDNWFAAEFDDKSWERAKLQQSTQDIIFPNTAKTIRSNSSDASHCRRNIGL